MSPLLGKRWGCLVPTREYLDDERGCLGMLIISKKYFCDTGVSVPKQRIHDFSIGCRWGMCERVSMEIILAGKEASAEKNLGAQCWIFSDQGGPVTARVDQFPPEEGMQRRDL